jgi:hypothetical protein
MRRLLRLSVAVLLCLAFITTTSAPAAKLPPAGSKIESSQPSLLERVSAALFDVVAALFGFDSGDESASEVVPESDVPVDDDGSGLDEGQRVSSQTRDDGWEYQR